ncbi:Hypp403 [Branchiostoma lanceolatum]|uniref:Hypp403 protein n=1 Tax=Branchiostoma lanceolatum TaxID=7740 RepID=A0A8J9V9S8_BRALA|nr:Hypp403 [Branchiostoma lanceolatum]
MSGTQNTTLWTSTPTEALNQTTQFEMTSTGNDFTTEHNVTITAPTTVLQNQTTSYTVSSERPANESTFRSTKEVNLLGSTVTTPAIISSVTTKPGAERSSRSYESTSTPPGTRNCTCDNNVSMLLVGTALGSVLATCVVCAIIFLVWKKFCHEKGTAYRDGMDNEEVRVGKRSSTDDNVSSRDQSESRPPAPLPRSELQDSRYLTLTDLKPVTSASTTDIALRETVGNIR